MNVKEFIEKLELALNQKTLYVNGAFGAPASKKNKERYAALPNNLKRASAIKACDSDTFFFDCSGLPKAILWGWNADKSKTYGGATYKANGIPDFNEEVINQCKDVSTNMNKMTPGELVYMKGHCGIYYKDDLVIECSPSWENGVQITFLKQRAWQKHGKLPWVEYEEKPTEIYLKPDLYHVVQKGDTLWGIAAKYLGSGTRWREIATYNNIIGSNIYINQIIKIRRDK